VGHAIESDFARVVDVRRSDDGEGVVDAVAVEVAHRRRQNDADVEVLAARAKAGAALRAGVSQRSSTPPSICLAAVRDFDGDGVDDAFAIVRPPDVNDPGEVAFYSRSHTGTARSRPPRRSPAPGLARDAAARPSTARRHRSGPCSRDRRAVPARVGRPHALGRRPAGGSAPKVGLEVTIVDPAGAPALFVDRRRRTATETRSKIHAARGDRGGGAPFRPVRG